MDIRKGLAGVATGVTVPRGVNLDCGVNVYGKLEKDFCSVCVVVGSCAVDLDNFTPGVGVHVGKTDLKGRVALVGGCLAREALATNALGLIGSVSVLVYLWSGLDRIMAALQVNVCVCVCVCV